MRNWFDIITPHEDIRNGDFNEAVFAANLGDVTLGTAPAEYHDPYTFFKRTYLTNGLESLLGGVHKKLTAGKGPSVVELKTPFGGGKTHSLVAVYHYLKNGKEIVDLLPDEIEPVSAPVCAVVGNQINTRNGVTSDNLTRYTLWGELAYQIGGKDAYDQIRENDEDRIAPGKNDLNALLADYQPFVILFDEVLEYVNAAHSVQVGDTSLATQTLTFLKQLTEAVAGLENGLFIVTLPSSELEDFGDTKQRDLAQLDKIFGRLVDIQTPVRGEEVYSIIRRRLFETVSNDSEVRDVIDKYIQKYQELKKELPGKVREAEYRKTMERAYPFHPDVIDILHEKWGTYGSFQRTRGVLRLLASVVEDLYEQEINLDLILPGDINLDNQAIKEEFLKHIGAEHESIISSDIANNGRAKSQILDKDNKEWKHLAEQISTGIFLHSFTADQPERGTDLSYIKLAVVHSETIPPLVTEVLQKLKNQLWYLNTRNEQFYFSGIPNLNRMVADKKGRIQKKDVIEELRNRVKRNLGNKLRTYLWPDNSNDVVDNTDLKLIVVNPDKPLSDKQLKEWFDKRGDNFRAYKNTLFFAIPDEDRFTRLQDMIKEYLSYKEIEDDIGAGHFPGLEGKVDDVKRSIRDIEGDFGQKIRELYRILGVPAADGFEKFDLGKPTFGTENLDTWIYSELTDDSHKKILPNPPSSRFITSKFLESSDKVALDTLIEQFYKNPGLPVPSERTIVGEAIAKGVKEGTFGYGMMGPENEIQPDSVRFGEHISAFDIQFQEDEYLLSSELAQQLKSEEQDEEYEVEEQPTDTSGDEHPGEGFAGDEGGTLDVPKEERVNEVHIKASKIKANKLVELHRGVMQPLIREAGDFEFTIEFTVKSSDGIKKKTLEQQVYETLKQLGAEIK